MPKGEDKAKAPDAIAAEVGPPMAGYTHAQLFGRVPYFLYAACQNQNTAALLLLCSEHHVRTLDCV